MTALTLAEKKADPGDLSSVMMADAEFPPDYHLPFRTVAMARTCEGKDMVLQEHEEAYFLYLGGEMLMGGKHHGSEETLGTLGCSLLGNRKAPHVLIGGLGMGYTLRAVLDALGSEARIVTAELSEEIITWNQSGGPLAASAGTPTDDPRSFISRRDLGEIIRDAEPGSFDAILIDTDNEPKALSYEHNNHLYSETGLQAIRRSLKQDGVLGFWFLRAPDEFDQLLEKAGFKVRRHKVPCGEGGTHLIIMATPRSSPL